MTRKPIGLSVPYRKAATEDSSVAEWRELMKGVRVDGDKVVIATKSNEAARKLCGALIEEMNK
jgi:tripartite-type tricarboxylate transporter receptor subunit TctC